MRRSPNPLRTPFGHWLTLLALAAPLLGCATVTSMRLEPEWETQDKSRVKRLTVVTSVPWHVTGQPVAQPPEKVRALWSLIARRYVNQKRNFLAKKDLAAEPNGQAQGMEVFVPKALCEEGIEGVLWLDPKLTQ